MTAKLRTLAFGDVDGGLWAAAVDAGSEGTTALAFGAGDVGETVAGDQLRLTADGRSWRLEGAGVALEVQARGEEAEDPDADPDPAHADVAEVQELCRVHGTLSIGGSERTVDCVGIRSQVDGLQPGTLDSARGVSGWFGDDEALTLLALRPRDAAHHDDDLVAATLFDPDGWVAVADPRLSTTYTEAGDPARTSLELWVGDGESEFPRRAAGETAGPVATLTAGALQLRVAPLRCHSRGLEGAGVYVLATF
jgi:hypothetical protein